MQHCCVAGWCVLLNILPCTGQFITQQNSFLQGVIWCCRKLNRLLLSTTKFWFIARITTTPTCQATKLEENGSDWFFHLHIKLTCDEFVRANPAVAKKHKQTMAERKPRVLTPVGGSWCKSSCYPLSHVYLLFLGNFFCRFQPPPPKKKTARALPAFSFTASWQQTSCLFTAHASLFALAWNWPIRWEAWRARTQLVTTNFVERRIGQVRGKYAQQHAPTCNVTMLRYKLDKNIARITSP